MTRYSVFGHRQTANSLEKSLMLGMIEGRRRRGHWRRRCLNGITDAMDLNLSKLQETVRDREAWCDTVHVFAKSQTWLGNWKTTTVCKQQHTHKTQRTPESLDRRLFLHYVHGKGNVYSGQLIHRKEHKLRKDTQKCSSISTQHRSVYDIPSQSVEMNFLLLFTFIVVLIQVLSPVWLFLTPWTTTCHAPLSSTTSQSLHKFRSIKSVILPISFSDALFSFWLHSFPSGSFPMSQLFSIGGQSIGTSASSISSSNEFLGLISFKVGSFDILAVQGLSRLFSRTTN